MLSKIWTKCFIKGLMFYQWVFKFSILIAINSFFFFHPHFFRIYWNITLSFISNYLGENKFLLSNKLLHFSIKNPGLLWSFLHLLLGEGNLFLCCTGSTNPNFKQILISFQNSFLLLNFLRIWSFSFNLKKSNEKVNEAFIALFLFWIGKPNIAQVPLHQKSIILFWYGDPKT